MKKEVVEKNSQIEAINAEISRELVNEAVGRALLATTFKKLNATSMRQAIMEGMIRGFKFKDFLEKNVYAIPFKDGYSLVTSIDYARKRGMRAGIVGKNAPLFEMDGKSPISCTVTVKRKIGDYVGEYTATVYFDEYTTRMNLWLTKPRTMLAKVAEMHALRMACPEELSQTYTEEEMDSEATQVEVLPMEPYRIERKVTIDEVDTSQSTPETQEVEDGPSKMRLKIISLLIKHGKTSDTLRSRQFDIRAITGIFWRPGANDEKIIALLEEKLKDDPVEKLGKTVTENE